MAWLVIVLGAAVGHSGHMSSDAGAEVRSEIQRLIDVGDHEAAAAAAMAQMQERRQRVRSGDRTSFIELIGIIDLVRAIHLADPDRAFFLQNEALGCARDCVAFARQPNMSHSALSILAALTRLESLLEEQGSDDERFDVVNETIEIARRSAPENQRSQNILLFARHSRIRLLIKKGSYDAALDEGQELANDYESAAPADSRMYRKELNLLTELVPVASFQDQRDAASSLASRALKLALEHQVSSPKLIETLIQHAMTMDNSEALHEAVQQGRFLYQMITNSYPMREVLTPLTAIESGAVEIGDFGVAEEAALELLRIVNSPGMASWAQVTIPTRALANLVLAVCLVEKGNDADASPHVDKAAADLELLSLNRDVDSVMIAMLMYRPAESMVNSALMNAVLRDALHRVVCTIANLIVERLGEEQQLHPLTRPALYELSSILDRLGDQDFAEELASVAARLSS